MARHFVIGLLAALSLSACATRDETVVVEPRTSGSAVVVPEGSRVTTEGSGRTTVVVPR